MRGVNFYLSNTVRHPKGKILHLASRSKTTVWSVQVGSRAFNSVGGSQVSSIEFKTLTSPKILMKATKFIGYQVARVSSIFSRPMTIRGWF